MCVGCSKEPSHWDGYFEYPQHMFWLRNKKNNFQICTLIWRPELFYLIFQLSCFNKLLWLKCSQLQLNYYMRLLSTRTIVAIKRCLFVPHPIGERYYILHMVNSKSKMDTSMLGQMYSHIMSPLSMRTNWIYTLTWKLKLLQYLQYFNNICITFVICSLKPLCQVLFLLQNISEASSNLAYGLSAANVKLNCRTEDGWSQIP